MFQKRNRYIFTFKPSNSCSKFLIFTATSLFRLVWREYVLLAVPRLTVFLAFSGFWIFCRSRDKNSIWWRFVHWSKSGATKKRHNKNYINKLLNKKWQYLTSDMFCRYWFAMAGHNHLRFRVDFVVGGRREDFPCGESNYATSLFRRLVFIICFNLYHVLKINSQLQIRQINSCW